MLHLVVYGAIVLLLTSTMILGRRIGLWRQVRCLGRVRRDRAGALKLAHDGDDLAVHTVDEFGLPVSFPEGLILSRLSGIVPRFIWFCPVQWWIDDKIAARLAEPPVFQRLPPRPGILRY